MGKSKGGTPTSATDRMNDWFDRKDNVYYTPTGEKKQGNFADILDNNLTVSGLSASKTGTQVDKSSVAAALTQEEIQYFRDKLSVMENPKDNAERGKIYDLYQKAIGGKRDTDATLISLNKAKAIKEAKKDMPGLRSQTLLKASNKDGTDNFQKLKAPPIGGNNTGNTGGTLL